MINGWQNAQSWRGILRAGQAAAKNFGTQLIERQTVGCWKHSLVLKFYVDHSDRRALCGGRDGKRFLSTRQTKTFITRVLKFLWLN